MVGTTKQVGENGFKALSLERPEAKVKAEERVRKARNGQRAATLDGLRVLAEEEPGQ